MSDRKKSQPHLTLVPGPVASRTQGELIHGTGSALAAAFDEAQFLIGRRSPGEGRKGGGESIQRWFRIHEGYYAEVRKILEDPGCVGLYETQSDFYVHAIIRHIEWVHSVAERIEGSILHELRQISEIVAEEERKIRFSRSLDAIGSVVADVLNMPGGKKECARMLRRMARHIERMRPGFWRSHYESIFYERFRPHMVEESPLFLFGPADGGEEDNDGDADDDRPFLYFPEVPESPEEEIVH